MKRALAAALLLGTLTAHAQQPGQDTCNLDAPPEPCRGMECKDACSVEGDPVNVNTGYTFHIAKDVELSSGDDTLKLHRYYVPTGGIQFKKSQARLFLWLTASSSSFPTTPWGE